MDLSSISLTSWAGLTAAGALLMGAWRYAVVVIRWFSDLFICRAIVKDEAARALMSHAWRHGRKSPFGLRLFGGVNSFVGPKKRVEIVGYEGVTSQPVLFWLGRVPVLIGTLAHTGNDTPAVGDWSTSKPPVTVRFFRGTMNIDDLIEQAVTAYNDLRQTRDQSKRGIKRFNVFRMHGSGGYKSEAGAPKEASGGSYLTPSSGNTDEITQQMHHGEVRLLTWKPEELVERSNDAAPFLNHPVAPELLAEFVEIQQFLAHENWFRSKGVPWRRGYLLTGPSGSGKSTVVRNLAMQYDLPIYSFDLSTYDNRSFTSDWKQVQQNAPAIALLEDFDCTFDHRTNKTVEGKNRDGLTFDCLLNTISGVGSSDGVLLFVTTNHPETLDPALGISCDGGTGSTRPGRIDKAVHIGAMGERERSKVCEIVLSDWPEIHADIVAAGDGEMAAQFQERCAQEAIRRFWKVGVQSTSPVPALRGPASLGEDREQAARFRERALRKGDSTSAHYAIDGEFRKVL